MVHNIYSYDIFSPCFYGLQTHLAYLYNATLDYLAAEGIQWEDNAGPPAYYQDICDVSLPFQSCMFVFSLAAHWLARCMQLQLRLTFKSPLAQR